MDGPPKQPILGYGDRKQNAERKETRRALMRLFYLWGAIYKYNSTMEVCDSRVVIGEHVKTNTLYLYHNMFANRLACNETLFTLAHSPSVSLCLEPLAHTNFTDRYGLRFQRDLLLVADWHRNDAIVSLRATVNGLSEPRVQRDACACVWMQIWALMGLVVSKS